MATVESKQNTNEIQGEHRIASTVQAWLVDHSVAGVALGVTLLAAGGYCVHRSWLFGWYQAAGIPAFAHSWSVQDVVMQGVTNLYVWLLGLLAVTLMSVAIYLEFVVVASAEKWLDRYLERRRVRRGDAMAAKIPQPQRGKFISHVATCCMFISIAALFYCLIALAVFLFSAQPRKLGYAQFQQIEKAASLTIKAAMAVPENADREANEVSEAREKMLDHYRYVQTTVGAGDATQIHCGWLVLQNGEHMLLLTRKGPLFLSASGLGFSWTPIEIEVC